MQSKPLTFGELKVGEYFVDFPTDGDDSGHGGFRGGAYVFEKINQTKDHNKSIEIIYNAVRLTDKIASSFPDTMLVFKVII